MNFTNRHSDSISVISTSKFNIKKSQKISKSSEKILESALLNNQLRQEGENNFSQKQVKCIYFYFKILYIMSLKHFLGFFLITTLFLKFIYLIYLYLAVLVLHCCTWALPSCSERGLLFFAVHGFLLWWLLLLWSMGSRHMGFSSCSMQAQQLWLAGSRAQAQQLWRTGLVAPWHVGSSWTRD